MALRHEAATVTFNANFVRLWALPVAILILSGSAIADIAEDCRSQDVDCAIRGCTVIIDDGSSRATDHAVAYIGRGNAFAAHGDHVRALADLTKAIELNPLQAGLRKALLKLNAIASHHHLPQDARKFADQDGKKKA